MDLVLVLDNVRSAHNVGALLRTADGLGVSRVHTGGLTPHPRQASDRRLPHVIKNAEHKLAKTGLGAERTLNIIHYDETTEALDELSEAGYYLVGLEQTANALDLKSWRRPRRPLALVVGHERLGLSKSVLKRLDATLMIPMRGRKESLNVAVAGAIAMYQLS